MGHASDEHEQCVVESRPQLSALSAEEIHGGWRRIRQASK